MITDPVIQAANIANVAGHQIEDKYARGQREHGGNFFAKPTVNNIREEVLDLVAYTHVVTAHQTELLFKLQELRNLIEPKLIDKYDEIIRLAEGL